MYKEYPPCPLLSPYIDKYWEFKGQPEYGMRINILPDGCTDFIFTLGEVANKVGNHLIMQPYRSYFVGPMTTYSELITYAQTVHMVGIRFLPCGISRFMNLPLQGFSDQRISTNDLKTPFDDSFTEMLLEKQDIKEQIICIEHFLIRSLYKDTSGNEKDVLFAVNQINLHQGNLPIQDLTNKICLCQRHFERKFKTLTGFTAKEYSRIIRFRNAIDLLKKEYSLDNLLSVAVKTGYYDVPHLSREVKRLSGNTPGSFLSLQPEETTLTYIKS